MVVRRRIEGCSVAVPRKFRCFKGAVASGHKPQLNLDGEVDATHVFRGIAHWIWVSFSFLKVVNQVSRAIGSPQPQDMHVCRA